MKAVLTIRCASLVRTFGLFLDETQCFLPARERPIDLVMEIMCAAKFSTKIEGFVRALSSASEQGISHIMAAVPPGAFKWHPLAPGFTPSADHHIAITITPETESRYASVFLSLDQDEPIRLSAYEFELAEEREGSPEKPLFTNRYGSDQAPPHPDERATGAIAAGYCAQIFDNGALDGVPRDRFTLVRFTLIGLLAASAGYQFDRFDESRDFQWVISPSKDQYANFLRHGYLVSERGWNPRLILPGPRLAQATAEADASLLAFSKKAAALLMKEGEPRLLRICKAILDSEGLGCDDLPTARDRPIKGPETKHEQLVDEALYGALQAFVATNPAPSLQRASQ